MWGLFVFRPIKQKSLEWLKNIKNSETPLVIFVYWFECLRNPSETWKPLLSLCVSNLFSWGAEPVAVAKSYTVLQTFPRWPVSIFLSPYFEVISFAVVLHTHRVFILLKALSHSWTPLILTGTLGEGVAILIPSLQVENLSSKQLHDLSEVTQ